MNIITKVLWEGFSIALLLYGLYLTYIFIWFSIYRIYNTDLLIAKSIGATVSLIILALTFFNWLRKKHKEVHQKEG
ncbi:hypothetical protein JCM14244_03080 [Venenivibrio stagnispumantis]|uniref:Uncharacterized protein n=1 Tax=Venenivibrio stagnispumantis TaxID=407998 RepID=A0AA45WM34_9AQUI|nr:hypothetical protein [Venenivibrio stagnispumantis]MCW4572844.1 hypothetical protein [Venenivibrio stagnispumantis]SMP13162.1 hypothetical protein SAMN06264868_11057 [Venenivibrio stagnispumantis]